MKIKQTSWLSKFFPQTALIIVIGLSTAGVLGFGGSDASAAANFCTNKYPIPTSGSPTAVTHASEKQAACKKGYNTQKCDTIVAGSSSSKATLKEICLKGIAQSKKDGVKPPPTEEPEEDPGDGSTGSCGGAETSIIKCDADNSGSIENNGVWALLLMAINILTAGIGIAAIGGIIYGSILYTTAGDNDSQVKSAKEIIRNVIIGIIAYVAMYALLQFIIPGGVFS